MKNIITFLLLVCLFACNEPTQNQKKSTEKLKIDSLTFEYTLTNGLLNDTLRIIRDRNRPFIEQIWNNGRLKKSFLIDTEKIEISFRKRNLPDSSIEMYYISLKDTNFKTSAIYNETIAKFYDQYKDISLKSLETRKVNYFEILNVPDEIVALLVPSRDSTILNKNGASRSIKTNRMSGDSIPITFMYFLCDGYQSQKPLIKLIK